MLKVYNISGRCVADLTKDLRWNNNGAKAVFDASWLSSGMYIVKLENESVNLKVKAFVVK